MLCKQCGKELGDGALFCPNCGAKQFDSPRGYGSSASANASERGYASPATRSGDGRSNGSVSFPKAVKLFFTNYVNFTGRASKSEYWWAFLFRVLVSLAIGWIPILGYLAELGMILPGLSIAVRRLHDTGKAWYWYLMGLIPLAGPIIFIVFMCQSSDGDNRWGSAFESPHPGTFAAPAYNNYPSDEEIVALALEYEPWDFHSESAMALMNDAIKQLIPTFGETNSLSDDIRNCDDFMILRKIALVDDATLMAAFKTLGYRIAQGEDKNTLGMVQRDVMSELKKRAATP